MADVGDATAFDTFYRNSALRLYGQAYVLTGSREMAQDLTHEAFLRAWKHWPQIADYEDPRPGPAESSTTSVSTRGVSPVPEFTRFPTPYRHRSRSRPITFNSPKRCDHSPANRPGHCYCTMDLG